MNLPKRHFKSRDIKDIVRLKHGYYTYFILTHTTAGFFIGNMEGPPEPPETEIITIFDETFYDITEQISDEDFEKLTELLNGQ